MLSSKAGICSKCWEILFPWADAQSIKHSRQTFSCCCKRWEKQLLCPLQVYHAQVLRSGMMLHFALRICRTARWMPLSTCSCHIWLPITMSNLFSAPVRDTSYSHGGWWRVLREHLLLTPHSCLLGSSKQQLGLTRAAMAPRSA